HRDLLQRGAPARGRRHGEALEAQRALEGLPDGRLVVDDEDQRLRADEPHAAAYPWRCPNPKAKPPRTSGRASLTFWTSMLSFCASSVANWSRACVATFWNAASSCAVVTPAAVAVVAGLRPQALQGRADLGGVDAGRRRDVVHDRVLERAAVEAAAAVAVGAVLAEVLTRLVEAGLDLRQV